MRADAHTQTLDPPLLPSRAGWAFLQTPFRAGTCASASLWRREPTHTPAGPPGRKPKTSRPYRERPHPLTGEDPRTSGKPTSRSSRQIRFQVEGHPPPPISLETERKEKEQKKNASTAGPAKLLTIPSFIGNAHLPLRMVDGATSTRIFPIGQRPAERGRRSGRFASHRGPRSDSFARPLRDPPPTASFKSPRERSGSATSAHARRIPVDQASAGPAFR